MPWSGDSYEYPMALIRAMVYSFPQLLEIAICHPDSDAAIRFFDLCRAISFTPLTRRQRQVLKLALQDLSQVEIGIRLGIDQTTISILLNRTFNKIYSYLNS